ncbi:mitochondrial import inner membrane translocase subunit Tim54 [Morchella snyderi]|nr:mitochondrial import inner membrane translocase subunit Tim54 [Morchella snyderi]
MAAPTPPKAAEGNPAFKYMGLPNIKAKLPSRNWLIFFGITGTFAAIVYHDRREQKRIQALWCSRVSHLALEPLGPLELPRKVTVYLSAPPGSGSDIRPAQEHYRDFVKPIFTAAALDVEFVEGRRTGELRHKVAEGIRKQRLGVDGEDIIEETRRKGGISRVGAVQGEVVVGRHAWKEYIRGLHEGWLGPLEAPEEPKDEAQRADDKPPVDQNEQVLKIEDVIADSEKQKSEEDEKKKEEDKKPAKPSVPPSYILPEVYSSAQLPPGIPTTFDPVGAVTHPHILGFLNTPIRLYRYVTRRHLADQCGREAAAIALGVYSRPFYHSPDPSATMSTEADVAAGLEADKECGEIEGELKVEEGDWPKKYWKEESLQGVWQEDIKLDARVAERMRKFFWPPRLETEEGLREEGIETKE